MSNKYFQDELAYLRQTGEKFGQAHPGLAASLAQRSTDPDVERLLEGFAFLTARIRERAEDCVPELAQELTEMLEPGYVRPLPAATVVQFDVQAQSLRGRHVLPRGTPIWSKPRSGAVCRFQTVQDCALLPLRLTDAKLTVAGGASYRLILSFALPSEAAQSVFGEEGLRLFFANSYAQASNLWLAVLRHTVALQADVGGEVTALSPQRITCPSLRSDAALFPGFASQHSSAQDYFALPSKFLFVDVGGLGAVRKSQANQFTLTFTFADCPSLAHPLTKDAVRLHCVPAINLFTETAVPLRTQFYGEDHLLRADGVDVSHQQVYDVTKVTSLAAGTGVRREYPAFSSHAHDSPGTDGHYYRVQRRLSPVDGSVDTYISFLSARGRPAEARREVVSVDLVCTNGALPAQLRHGDLCVLPTTGLPIAVREVTEVSPALWPPLGDELYWQLLAQMALAHREVRDASSLRELLACFHLQRHARLNQGAINARRIDAVRELVVGREQRLVRGVPVGGLRYTVALDRSGFVSDGDAFLFGLVLDDVFANAQAINTSTCLTLRTRPTMKTYDYPVRGL